MKVFRSADAMTMHCLAYLVQLFWIVEHMISAARLSGQSSGLVNIQIWDTTGQDPHACHRHELCHFASSSSSNNMKCPKP